MSSFRSESAGSDTVPLRVDASPGTEIFVLSHRFELVAKGVGHIDTALAPGLYKLKFCAGNVIREQMLTVARGSVPIAVVAPAMPFSSAAPLPGTRLNHEYHEGAAYQHSRKIHLTIGSGAELFILARTWTSPEWTPVETESADPAQGLSLHALDGTQLVDFEQTGPRQLDMLDAWSACTTALAPGTYRMRLRTGSLGTLEWTVVMCAGWQTQVYLLTKEVQGEESTESGPGRPLPERVADPSTACVLMRGLDDTQPEPDFRLTELARMALMRKRSQLGREVVDEMLSSKFGNPMLGIFGALLLLEDESDRNLAVTVVKNVRRMLGSHPDVAALELALNLRTTIDPPTPPPLLSRSWQVLLDASQANPDLIPSDSLAARIASRTWGDSAWLIWKLEEQEAPGSKSGSGHREPSHRAIPSNAGHRFDVTEALGPEAASDVYKSLIPSMDRTTTELALLGAIASKLPVDKYQRLIVPPGLDDYDSALVRNIREKVVPTAGPGMEPISDNTKTATLQLARSLSLPPGSVPQLVSRTLGKLSSELAQLDDSDGRDARAGRAVGRAQQIRIQHGRKADEGLDEPA